jgi:type IV pilus assembly protein PilE
MRRIREAGFTLVELLVCVAIIGLLAALAFPRVASAIMTSREAQVQADLKLIETALAQHYLEHGFYPIKLNDLEDRGYLPSRMTFKSPVSGHWYFYAVDNGKARSARAFILGAPPKNAGDEVHLFHAGPLPRGKNPANRATAWSVTGESDLLNLYTENDEELLDDIPQDLSDYRDNCKPVSTTLCDLWTN